MYIDIKYLEILNSRRNSLLYSTEYRHGKKHQEFKEALHNKDLKKIILNNLHKIVRRLRYGVLTIPSVQIDYTSSNDMNFNNYCILDGRVAVYTCITAGYDYPIEPICIDKNIDYYLVTDQNTYDSISTSDTVWNPILIELIDNDPQLTNRFYKFNPFKLFDNYDYVIYIDGNIEIVTDIKKFLSIATCSNLGIAVHEHAIRNCIYDEGRVCKALGRGSASSISRWLGYVKMQSMPRGFGLYEMPLIIYDMSNKHLRNLLKEFWYFYIYSECRRDQLVLPYVVWKLGYKYSDIGLFNSNLYNNPSITKHDHIL